MSDDLADMLQQASAEVMAGDPILRKAFAVALLSSDLFLPVEQDESEQDAQGGVSLQAIEIDGEAHVLIFSSKEKLGKFMKDGTRFARASGAQVLPTIRHARAVLNPGKTGRVFAPEDFDEILGPPPGGHPKQNQPEHDQPEHGQPGHVHGPNCSHEH